MGPGGMNTRGAIRNVSGMHYQVVVLNKALQITARRVSGHQERNGAKTTLNRRIEGVSIVKRAWMLIRHGFTHLSRSS